jgi:hypothetical protein
MQKPEYLGIMKNKLSIAALALLVVFASCGGGNDSPEVKPEEVKKKVVPANLPAFSADSAYKYTAAQVAFGPRVPNTPAHVKCGDYLIAELNKYGAMVIVQAGNVTAYTGESLKFRNIVGRIQPELKERIMISCHWDTRPFSDRDPEKPKERFDGAVDGAASAGIMLEIARILKSKPASVGVDLVFFDAEDYGNPSDGNSYCLGSQYFAARPPFTDNFPKFGINLDMVAAQSATFYREGYSMEYASDIVFKVWDIANELGHKNTFVPENSSAITDDHFFINSILGIKTIDVIHHDPSTETGFGSYWHTQKDNMDAVNKGTMQIVGHTLLGVIYSEKPGV